MKFEYSALNNENKKLTGFINADSEESAHSQLNELGLAILTLSEVRESLNDHTPAKLKFEGLDKNGKKIIGTIPETDYSKAYKRLVEEYSFQVIALYPIDASQSDKEKAQNQIAELKNKYEIDKANENVPDALDANDEIMRQKLLAETEVILSKVSEVEDLYSEHIKPEELKHINEIKDKLLRLKNSNNLQFIKQSMQELLVAVQNKEIFLSQTAFVNEREKIKLETQKLLFEVERLDVSPNVFQSKKSETTNDELSLLKKKKAELNKMIFDYIRLWFKASKQIKPELAQKLKELISERRNIGKNLSNINAKKSKFNAIKQVQILSEGDLENLSTILLGFYIFYYFVRYYLDTKAHSLQTISQNEFIFNSPILLTLLIPMMVINAIFVIKSVYEINSNKYFVTVFPIAFVIIILLNINF